jgi:hypothetical protein
MDAVVRKTMRACRGRQRRVVLMSNAFRKTKNDRSFNISRAKKIPPETEA